MAKEIDCPCGSGRSYAVCCGPLISGTEAAPTAEALMRARYTAYARHEIEYLYTTSGPAVQRDFDETGTRKWAEAAEWLGFECIEKSGGGERDARGIVEFIARYEANGRECNHHERAHFERIEGEWRFVEGDVFGPDPYKRETPKIGRNEPCPCGSGRKHKKCCGAPSGDG